MASVLAMTRLPSGAPAPGTKWRCFIRMRGHGSHSKVFGSEREANEYGTITEAKLLSGVSVNFKALGTTTVRDVFAWYIEEAAPERRRQSWKWETNALLRLSKESFTLLTLDRQPEISQGLRLYIQRRLSDGIKGQSLNRELNLVSTTFEKMKLKTGFIAPNPVKGQIERPKTANVRAYKTWTEAAMQTWLKHLAFDADQAPTNYREYLPWALLLLNTTGLRPVSLFATKLAWIDLDNWQIVYPADVVKNGEIYDCPLADDALAAVAKLMAHQKQRNSDKLFDCPYGSVATHYAAERAALAEHHPELADLHLYGQRHTWMTLNLPIFANLGLAMKYTGRKSVKSLLPYIQDSAKVQAERLNAARRAARAGTLLPTDHSQFIPKS